MKNNKKGFTLAELLVVVAIIAVLVAIAIPVFSGALTKAEQAADVANVRAAYAQAVVNKLTDDTPYPASYPSYGAPLKYKSTNLSWKVSGGKLHVKYTASKLKPSVLSLVGD